VQNVSFEIHGVGRIVKQFNPIFPFAGVVAPFIRDLIYTHRGESFVKQ
jgi:hypothetical protein